MYAVRPFIPEESEYETCVTLSNLANPTARPSTVTQWKATHDEWETSYHYQQFVVEKTIKASSNVIVAVGAIFEVYWAYHPGDYTFWFNVHPEFVDREIDQVLFEHMVTSLRNRTPLPTKLTTLVSEDQTDRIQFLLAQGFQAVERQAELGLAVQSFDIAPFAGLEEKCLAAGIHIYTLAQLFDLEPDWKTKLYRLRIALDQDVPGVGPKVDITLAQFEEMYLDDPALDPEAWWVAVEAQASDSHSPDLGIGTFVGYSNLWINDETRKRLDTGMTGILANYRRRGIATLLKVKAIVYGQRHKSEQIVTQNEQNNPMVDLNRKLGFEQLVGTIRYEKIA